MFFRKQQTESTEPKFKTEKQLISHIIHNFTKIKTYSNSFYEENALPEWKEKYDYVDKWSSGSYCMIKTFEVKQQIIQKMKRFSLLFMQARKFL